MTTADHDARREDLEWLAETGETILGAARRLGISRGALEKWCDVHDQRTLYHRLQRNGGRGRAA